MTRQRLVAGGILAGGESLRMGELKEGVRLPDGRPMIEHVIDAVRGALDEGAPIAIAGRSAGWRIPPDSGLHHVFDRRQGRGPMGGLEALLGSRLGTHYLVCSCDQPLLTSPLLRRLVNAPGDRPTLLRSESGAILDPFPCLLPDTWLTEIRNALSLDRLSVRVLLRGSDPEWVVIPDAWIEQVRSINTPEDLARLKADLETDESR